MAKITKTDHGHPDNLHNVTFFTTPQEPLAFHHPTGATYKVKVSNEEDQTINISKLVAVTGPKDIYKQIASVGPGDTNTIDTVIIEHNAPPHPGKAETVKLHVNYLVEINGVYHTIEFDIEAICEDDEKKTSQVQKRKSS